MIKKRLILIFLDLILFCLFVSSQNYGKMSPFVRHIAASLPSRSTEVGLMKTHPYTSGSLCAFVRISGNGESVLEESGCRLLARYGDIYIADIPIGSLSSLSSSPRVSRIEASRGNSICLDTTSIVVDAVKAYSGTQLPQAYTGDGVVLGVMDVGFDVTHPGFYDGALSHTRISRFWDQLSPDSLGSSLYVGADYRSEPEILAYGHSHDGLIETHGTHTLGIATGTGYDTKYRGMAPDADVCVVSNAVDTDVPLIPENQLYKYTTATDALGFKYIFDYAEETGKPCVISFSEGSHESLDGEQQLYYETLSRMTGPGKIIVASAGNDGHYNNYLHKALGEERNGMFVVSTNGKSGSVTARSRSAFDISVDAYFPDGKKSMTTNSVSVLSSADSLYVDSIESGGQKVVFRIQAYRSAASADDTTYDLILNSFPSLPSVSIAFSGSDADVEVFSNGLVFLADSRDTSLSGGEPRSCIGSPGAAPSVICVGATAYRQSYTGADGIYHEYSWGKDGEVGRFSSVGPTRYGLIKPDVVAPGTYVYSSLSSFYPEGSPDGEYISDITSWSQFGSRRYPWGALSGTSQATPVVAGAIALWLEANPSLSPSDILDVFSKTCNRRNFLPSTGKDNSAGYGEIDVYAGLLHVLGFDGIAAVSMNNPSALSMQISSDDAFFLLSPDTPCPSDAILNIYALSGKLVKSSPLSFSDREARFSLSLLPPGVYAFQISTAVPGVNGSFLVRR